MPGFGGQFDTVEDAAAAALMWLARQPRAVQQEYMGMLFKDPETEKFFRGEFATSGKRDSVEASFEPLGPVAGFVHNHPARRRGEPPSEKFSATDAETAKALGAPGFLTALQLDAPGEHRRLDPARMSNVQKHEVRKGNSIHGRQFLAQFPIEEFKQALARQLLGRGPKDRRGLRREAPGLGADRPLRAAEQNRQPAVPQRRPLR